MNVDEMVNGARDALTVRRVFGEPIERGAITIVPVAKAMGGSGGASGEGQHGDSEGGGSSGGFGLHLKPAGVYVIEGDRVRWVPAVDPVRMVLAAGLTGATVLAVVARALRRRDPRPARILHLARAARTLAAPARRR